KRSLFGGCANCPLHLTMPRGQESSQRCQNLAAFQSVTPETCYTKLPRQVQQHHVNDCNKNRHSRHSIGVGKPQQSPQVGFSQQILCGQLLRQLGLQILQLAHGELGGTYLPRNLSVQVTTHNSAGRNGEH